MRLAPADILLLLAPLAALLWILPQAQGWASLWAQRFVSTVFTQFVQMLALSIGISLVTGLPTGGAAALIQPLLGIAVLAVGLKIPSLIEPMTNGAIKLRARSRVCAGRRLTRPDTTNGE